MQGIVSAKSNFGRTITGGFAKSFSSLNQIKVYQDKKTELRKSKLLSPQIHPISTEEDGLITIVNNSKGLFIRSQTCADVLKQVKFDDDNCGTLEDGHQTKIEYEKLLAIETGNLILACIGIILSIYSVHMYLMLKL